MQVYGICIRTLHLPVISVMIIGVMRLSTITARVCNSNYEPAAMIDFMRSVKHLTQVLIVSVYCVDPRRKFADSDVIKNLHFRSNCGR